MKIKIEQLKIADNKSNEVTSYKVFKDRKPFDANGNPNFHPEGIFSKKIFGQYRHCDCGKLTKAGVCTDCNVRVLRTNSTPDYYISFKGIDIPKIFIDYTGYSKLKKNLEKLFNYEAFIYDGKIINFDLKNINIEDYPNKSKILIGREAILSLGVDKEWYKNQITNKLYIPHPSFRPITIVDKKHYLGSFNTSLITLLKRKQQLLSGKISKDDKFLTLSINNEIVKNVKNVYNEIFLILSKRKKSIINTEIRGQSLTGAVRGVVTNNFSLDEDTIVIGKYFIKTLYPELMLKHCDNEMVGIEKDGSGNQIWEPNPEKINIESLNKELAEKNYLVLVNRPPTIGEKSILAMRPVFSDKENEKYVLQVNPIIQDGLAGDFDGDAFLVMALYTTEANKEAELLLPSRNYIGGADDSIRNGLPEDFVYVMQKTYEDENEEEISKIKDIIYGGAN